MNKLDRREFLRLLLLGAGGVSLNACTTAPTLPTVATPDIQTLVDEGVAKELARRETLAAATATVTSSPNRIAATVTSTVTTRSSELLKTFEAQGIEVDIKDLHPEWPISCAAAASAISGGGARPIKPEHMVPVIERTSEGKKVWRGWWMGEPGFKLKASVKFDSTLGTHVDSGGKSLYDVSDIFDFSKAPAPTDLADLRLNVEFAGFFARRGGATRDGLPQNTHYYGGTPGTRVEAVEQVGITPAPKDLCPDNWTQAAVTRSWRMAASSFRSDTESGNRDARDGFMDGGQRKFIRILWLNPETNKFDELNGRMLSRLAREGHNLSVIERLPAGWPISPDKVVEKIGGRQDGWVFDPRSGEWFFEAFGLLQGVTYSQGEGHVLNGKLLVGIEQADGSRTQVFDFKAGPRGMADKMLAPGNLSGTLFVRVGGEKGEHWYTHRKGNVVLNSARVEQGTLAPHGYTGCPVGDISVRIFEEMRSRALADKDPNVTQVWYWDQGQGKFISTR